MLSKTYLFPYRPIPMPFMHGWCVCGHLPQTRPCHIIEHTRTCLNISAQPNAEASRRKFLPNQTPSSPHTEPPHFTPWIPWEPGFVEAGRILRVPVILITSKDRPCPWWGKPATSYLIGVGSQDIHITTHCWETLPKLREVQV